MIKMSQVKCSLGAVVFILVELSLGVKISCSKPSLYEEDGLVNFKCKSTYYKINDKKSPLCRLLGSKTKNISL